MGGRIQVSAVVGMVVAVIMVQMMMMVVQWYERGDLGIVDSGWGATGRVVIRFVERIRGTGRVSPAARVFVVLRSCDGRDNATRPVSATAFRGTIVSLIVVIQRGKDFVVIRIDRKRARRAISLNVFCSAPLEPRVPPLGFAVSLVPKPSRL